MATRFEALDELFDDALELPVKGRDGEVRTYRVPSPSAEDGLRINRLTAMAVRLVGGGQGVETEALDDEEELALIADALGPAHEEMLADGVDWAWMRHAGLTAVLWITQGPEAAGTYWKAAGDPTRLAPNRAARRAKSSGSAAASKTRKQASTSGTSGRPAGKSARKASPA